MLRPLQRAVTTVGRRVFSTLPSRFLRQVEHSARLAQGKGWGAGTATQEVSAVLQLLPKGARQNPVVLDVGANIGNWTDAFISEVPTAVVYAFEPSTTAFISLSERFAGDRRIHPLNIGVGDEDGMAELWSPEPGSGLASLSQRRLDHINIQFVHSEKIEIVTLDSWQRTNACEPTVLKMDVEGHELAVLRGAQNVLKSVEVVQFEFGGCNIDTRTFFQDFFYYFRENNFKLFRLGPNGLDAIERYTELDEAFTTTNFFAKRV